MAYTLTYYNNTSGGSTVTVPDGTTVSLGNVALPGRNFSGYGQAVDQNFLSLVENFASSQETGPSNPITGQLWYDTANTNIDLRGLKYNTGNTSTPNWAVIPKVDANGNGTFGNLEVTGNLTVDSPGVIIGNLQGNVTGNLFGNVTGGNISANVITANTFNGGNFSGNFSGNFIGNGSRLFALTGANVTGWVPNANISNTSTNSNYASYAGNITIATQGNITSLGTLTSLTVSGTTSLANTTIATLSVNTSVSASSISSTSMTAVGATISGNLSSGNISVGTNASIGQTLTATTANISGTLKAGTVDTSNLTFSGNLSVNSVTVVGNVSGGNLTTTGAVAASSLSATTATLTNDLSARNANLSGNITGNTVIANTSLRTTNITTGAFNTPGTISGNWTLTAGSRLQATYADLAERHHSDRPYTVGTIMTVGGPNEVTAAENGDKVLGVVTQNYAYLMNATAGSQETHPAIAYVGRVPVRIIGPIRSHQQIVVYQSGVATAASPTDNPQHIFGWAIETNQDSAEKIVLCIIK